MDNIFKKVAVVGLGYIGLPTALVLANSGVKVLGIDINEDAVNTINQGKVHIVEPDLDALVHKVVKNEYFYASIKPEPADVFIIAVPTPFKDNHKPDLSYIESAVKSISTVLKKGNLVILESTSPVGTTEQVSLWLADLRPDLSFPHQVGELADIDVAYCPERVLPGKILAELISNDRVIGGMTSASAEKARMLYKLFVQGECFVTNARTAEMCKLTENSFRDVNIAFANELSFICDKLQINVWELIRLANHHPRVNILQPGPGVGGHCIAVDPWFIVDKTPEEAQLIRLAREVNDSKPYWVINKVKQAIADYLLSNSGASVNTVTLACFGLAFKPDTDDVRESPAVEIVAKLAELGLRRIIVADPYIQTLPAALLNKNIQLVSEENALFEGDILVMLVNHRSFYSLTIDEIKKRNLIDTRGVWE